MRISDWSSDVCSSDLREWRGSLVAIDNRVRSALIAPMRFGASTRSNCLYNRQLTRPFERTQVPLETLDEFNPFVSIYLRRSEELLVGKECVSTCISRSSPYH